MSQPDIEYFYSAHSAFAYIGSARIMEIAAQAGRRLMHRPFHLTPVMEAAGGAAFGKRSQAHIDYFFGREIERWAAFRNVPIIDYRPTNHDEDMTLASCLLIAAQETGLDTDSLAHDILQAHWRDDADIADSTVLAAQAEALGIDAKALLERAAAPDIRDIYKANTREAITRSVFGSPSYFVDGDMYYGQDHLELIEDALKG